MCKCVAMILAGGQGVRLEPLTTNEAKPALGFGGKYKIIDWTLSNASNSGIDTVGVLTQYQPLELNRYIADGSAWGLNYKGKGITILPPYVDSKSNSWYLGTANAIYQNIKYIDSCDAEYVLVLSGDHVYRMDYSKMLEHHIRKGVTATVAVIDVPKKEASRFGIMKVNKYDEIIEFQEKPKNPDSTLASMGVYIFTWNTLKRQLIIDANNKNSANDFGKNVIPQYLSSGERISVFKHDGYWMDVGTIDSYYRANMDALTNRLSLDSSFWKLFGNFKNYNPSFVSKSANISNSLVCEGSIVSGDIKKSIISPKCNIAEGACVENSILSDGAKVGSGAKIYNAILSKDVVIGKDAVIGELGGEITVIGQDVRVSSGVRVPAGYKAEINVTKTIQTDSEDKKKKLG